MSSPVPKKRCSACGQEQFVRHFHRKAAKNCYSDDPLSPYNYVGICKACASKQRRERWLRTGK